jgi:hypothetical protein
MRSVTFAVGDHWTDYTQETGVKSMSSFQEGLMEIANSLPNDIGLSKISVQNAF